MSERMLSDVIGKANWKDMGNIYVNECANNTESQNWFVNPDGRIALEPSGQSKFTIHIAPGP